MKERGRAVVEVGKDYEEREKRSEGRERIS